MAFTEDPSLFFADFGERCTLGGSEVRAMFDTQTVDAFGDILTSEPSAMVRAADASTAAAGTTFARAGVTYTVRAVRAEPPDGAFVRLTLARG